MKNILSTVLIVYSFSSSLSFFAQYSSNTNDKNVNSKKKENKIELLHEDDYQSTYLLSIVNKVNPHYHKNHTENIFVIKGKAKMNLAGKEIVLKKGMHVNIPKGIPHSIDKIIGISPLIVISVQSPKFDKSDRIFIDIKNK